MPRSNRHRRDGGDARDDAFKRLLTWWKGSESPRGVVWTVQPVSAAQAQKPYVCPGCGREIVPGTAHLVVWRADGILGDAADLAARRHWHTACWRIG